VGDDKPEVRRHGRAYLIREKARPLSREESVHRGKVLHMEDIERAEQRRRWLLTAGITLAALVAGALIGRFLLP
jgi:hypothetical protein